MKGQRFVLLFVLIITAIVLTLAEEEPECRVVYSRVNTQFGDAYRLILKYGQEACKMKARKYFPDKLARCNKMFESFHQSPALDCLIDLHMVVVKWLPGCIPDADDLGVNLELTLDYDELENVSCPRN